MRRTTMLLATAALVAALLPASVAAQQPPATLVLSLVEGSMVGETVTISALLTDPEGSPVAGEEITFTSEAQVMNVYGEIGFGSAITDEGGVAAVTRLLKRDGEVAVTAVFEGSRALAPSDAVELMEVAPGPPTFEPPEPFRIPGANVYILALILGSVWSIYFGVVFLFWLVSRGGGVDESPARRVL